MPRNTKVIWRYRAIPSDLDDRVKQIVEADKYPTGLWHSQDHFYIEAAKQLVAKIEEEKERGEKHE